MAKSRYTWDPKALRYRGASGRFVTRKAVNDGLESIRDTGRQRVEKLTQDLIDRRINLAEWELAMRDEIKSQHVLAAGIARGGKKQLSPSELGRIGQITRVQYEKLSAYARQIANGEAKPSIGRSKMYINASRGTFMETERRMFKNAGYDVEFNVLHARESCEGCVEQSSKGKVPIGTLVPIGRRTCLVNCQCDIQYEKAA